jgi:hypothetical protein
MTKFCIDCIYATKTYPPAGAPFYQCAHPDYVLVNIVDETKYWGRCDELRKDNDPVMMACGIEARGYLPIVLLGNPASPMASGPFLSKREDPSLLSRIRLWLRKILSIG